MNVTEIRTRNALAREEMKQAKAKRARMLHEHGFTIVKIAFILNVSESTARRMLKDD